MYDKSQITGLILAGGAGRRAGGVDKGLAPWNGKPLVARVLQRIRPQVGNVILCCNRNIESYRAMVPTVICDLRPDYQGPLAGLESAGTHIDTEFLLLTPCDTPTLPLDLAERLLLPLLQEPELDICYAHCPERDHYLSAMLRTRCLASLPAYLDSGQRRVRDWYHQHTAQAVAFPDEEAFANINQPG